MISRLKAGLYSFIMIYATSMLTNYLVDTGLVPFYDILEKPVITPEKNYFVYIWNTIYVLLFTSFYLAFITKQSQEQFIDVCSLSIMMLFLQILWSFCFFYLQQLFSSVLVIIILDIVSALLMHTLIFVNAWSFVLMIPYFLWLLFATYLNIFIVFLN